VFSEFKIIVFLHIFDDKNQIVDIYLNLEGLINRCCSIVFDKINDKNQFILIIFSGILKKNYKKLFFIIEYY